MPPGVTVEHTGAFLFLKIKTLKNFLCWLLFNSGVAAQVKTEKYTKYDHWAHTRNSDAYMKNFEEYLAKD